MLGGNQEPLTSDENAILFDSKAAGSEIVVSEDFVFFCCGLDKTWSVGRL
jgi:hypothetical protein